MTHVAGFSENSMTFIMVLAGLSMTVGNLMGGKFSDQYGAARVVKYTQVIMASGLLAIFFAASVSWLAVILMCICTAGLFAVSAPQQLLLLRNSRGGEMMGAACVQVAFNLGNAIGAYAGGAGGAGLTKGVQVVGGGHNSSPAGAVWENYWGMGQFKGNGLDSAQSCISGYGGGEYMSSAQPSEYTAGTVKGESGIVTLKWIGA
jgi:MFS family permease